MEAPQHTYMYYIGLDVHRKMIRNGELGRDLPDHEPSLMRIGRTLRDGTGDISYDTIASQSAVSDTSFSPTDAERGNGSGPRG
jgi:hypothetical protein